MSLSSDSSIGSDSLRKAIERNRAKQAKRGSRTASTINSSGTVVGEDWVPPSSRRRSTSTTSSTRRTVARPDEFEFTNTRRGTQRAPAPVAYSRASTKISRPFFKFKKWTDVLQKGVWVFCGYLVLRLIFSGGGIIDFYTKNDQLDSKNHEYELIQKENQELAIEIDHIQNSAQYQKKLVRDHLGFISQDEFLILFAKEDASTQP